jgi:membrane-bound lytic murein transglycosylase D
LPKYITGRNFIRFVLISTLVLSTSCAHQKAQKNKLSKNKIITDAKVSSVLSAEGTTQEQSQAAVDKLLDVEDVDNTSLEPFDTDNVVAIEDATYNEQDQAEDIVEKLLAEKDSKANEVKEPETFVEIKNHPLVHKWITYFTKTDRERFIRFMTNGAKYRDAIEKIFDEEGVPRDLFFVGMIESGFFLKAKSHANAVGPWQFIRATGKRYGLIVSKTLDERKDLYKSTRAAARYFRDLYKIFGSWELAMSAYNAGEYGIMRRIKRAKTENFFSMATRGYLHPETVNYVPKVMAVLHIYQNLDKYGFDKIDAENPFDKTISIKLKHSHSLRLIANTLDMELETLQFLNSELPTPYTPYIKNGHYQLRVPKSAWNNRGQDLIAALRKQNSIIPATTLARYERDSMTKKQRKIFANKKFVKFSLSSKSQNVITTNQPLIYTVRNGENLTTIAKRFKVNPSQIAKFNRLSKNHVLSGQKIKIPGSVRTYYKVKRGDNLYSIAKKFNLTPNFLKQLNDLNAGDIYAGQKLLVYL